MMSMLPAIPVLLLGIVAVWFLWPIVVDPLTRITARRNRSDDGDLLAQDLFDAWTRLSADRS